MTPEIKPDGDETVIDATAVAAESTVDATAAEVIGVSQIVNIVFIFPTRISFKIATKQCCGIEYIVEGHIILFWATNFFKIWLFLRKSYFSKLARFKIFYHTCKKHSLLLLALVRIQVQFDKCYFGLENSLIIVMSYFSYKL